MKKIAIIKTGSTEEALRQQHGDFEFWIAKKTGLPESIFSILDVLNMDSWPSAESFKSIIITGSHTNVTDRPDWLPELEDCVRKAHDHSVPILGICFGHQLLAHAFGGEVSDNPQGPEFGSVPIALNTNARLNPLFQELPTVFSAFMSHRQSVVRLPEGAVRLAVSPKDQNAAFYLEPNLWGVQFHPEFDSTIMAWYLKNHFHIPDSELARYLPSDQFSPNIIGRFIEINSTD